MIRVGTYKKYSISILSKKNRVTNKIKNSIMYSTIIVKNTMSNISNSFSLAENSI